MSAEGIVVGIKPWLPPPLATSPWWTTPVAAERLAAVRVAVGLTLVLDVAWTYLPRMADFFGEGSVSQTAAFAHPAAVSHRLLLLPVRDPIVWALILIAWAGAGALLAAGIFARLAAGFAWFVSMSLVAMNPNLHNAGDQVRTILLLMMTVAPSSAVWSLSRRAEPSGGVRIYPWPLRLLFLQLAIIYFMNGLFKVFGDEWRSGEALAILLGDSGWIRGPLVSWPIPAIALRLGTWVVIGWELAFGWLVQIPRLRLAALLFGVAFHIVTAATMRVGMFPIYMLCVYMMFVPWEHLSRR